jgi:flagellar hook-basal body complex protein FliE
MSPISALLPSMGGVMPNVDAMTPETTQIGGAGIPNLAAMTMETPSLSTVQGAGLPSATGLAGLNTPATGGALNEIEMPSELAAPAGGIQGGGNSFSSMLSQMVADVNAKQNIAGESVAALQSGQSMPLHQAVIAMEEANVSFQLMVEVRNRLLDGYQEIMRMQV